MAAYLSNSEERLLKFTKKEEGGKVCVELP